VTLSTGCETGVVGIDFADVADGLVLFVMTAPMRGLREAHTEHIAGTLNLPAGTSIAMPGDLAVAQVALPQAVPCRGRDSPSENGRTVGAGRVTNMSP
jgi:translation elongation factor EF-Tu-like GTPase